MGGFENGYTVFPDDEGVKAEARKRAENLIPTLIGSGLSPAESLLALHSALFSDRTYIPPLAIDVYATLEETGFDPFMIPLLAQDIQDKYPMQILSRIINKRLVEIGVLDPSPLTAEEYNDAGKQLSSMQPRSRNNSNEYLRYFARDPRAVREILSLATGLTLAVVYPKDKNANPLPKNRIYPEVTFQPGNVGVIRTVGKRSNNLGKVETVYAPVVVVMENAIDANYSLFHNGHLNPLPLSYYPPTVGLDHLFGHLTSTYEKMPDFLDSQKRDPNYAKEAFLQLYGVAIHPFSDGNGRTFAAQLALSMQKRGLNLSINAAQSLIKSNEFSSKRDSLDSLTSELVNTLIGSAGLRHIWGPEHLRIQFDPTYRAYYMTALNRTIIRSMREFGTTKDPHRVSIIQRATEIIANATRSLQ